LFCSLGFWARYGVPEDVSDGLWVSGDYHLRSQAGRWDALNPWFQDEITSPCIDAGNPSTPISSEPLPNGGRINMGAYGGTSQASLSQ
jgi:hypothetical protein